MYWTDTDIPEIHEIDPVTHESTGIVHALCSAMCVDLWIKDEPGTAYAIVPRDPAGMPRGTVCEVCGKSID